MFGLGPMEMLIIGGLGVLLFGKRLPEVGRSLGKGIVEFKKGINGVEEDIHQSSTRSSSSSTAQYSAPDDHEEATAPKFDPPTSSPKDESVTS